MPIEITLIRRISDFVNVRDRYTIDQPGYDFDGTRERKEIYALPAGYSIDEDITGALQVYSPDGEHCEIAPFQDHGPQLIDGTPRGGPSLIYLRDA